MRCHRCGTPHLIPGCMVTPKMMDSQFRCSDNFMKPEVEIRQLQDLKEQSGLYMHQLICFCFVSMAGKLDVAASFGSVFLEYAKHFDVNACYVSNYVTAEEILYFLIEHCKPFKQMVENIVLLRWCFGLGCVAFFSPWFPDAISASVVPWFLSTSVVIWC